MFVWSAWEFLFLSLSLSLSLSFLSPGACRGFVYVCKLFCVCLDAFCQGRRQICQPPYVTLNSSSTLALVSFSCHLPNACPKSHLLSRETCLSVCAWRGEGRDASGCAYGLTRVSAFCLPALLTVDRTGNSRELGHKGKVCHRPLERKLA